MPSIASIVEEHFPEFARLIQPLVLQHILDRDGETQLPLSASGSDREHTARVLEAIMLSFLQALTRPQPDGKPVNVVPLIKDSNILSFYFGVWMGQVGRAVVKLPEGS